jgi:pilus assembly protein CpaF
MKLSERLRQQTDDTLVAPVATASAGDPVEALKHRVQDALYERLGARLYDPTLNDDQLRSFVRTEVAAALSAERAPLTASERARLLNEISDDVLGYGPIERFLADPSVTEVMVNGTSSVYVERAGILHRTDVHFLSDEHVRHIIDRIVAAVGRRVDESSPMVDARLPDGSRVNAIIPPLAVDGPVLTIRKFAHERWGVDDLVRFRTMTPEMADLLARCVEGKLNILVSGGTGTGKTTLLNILSSFVPAEERVVTIEDAVELQLQQDHVVRLESRPPNIEGRGRIDVRDLVRNALRMRPDRIIVGEVRGGEALDMLQAMNTGHEGSLSTVHANSPRDALSRVETMVLMAGLDLPARAVREQVASALDLIVHLTRMRDGTRRITQVTEVVGMEGDVVTLQDIFVFNWAAGLGEDGLHAGTPVATGIRPLFGDKLAERGVSVPAELLGPALPLRRAR